MKKKMSSGLLWATSLFCAGCITSAQAIKDVAQPRDEISQLARVNFTGALMSSACSLAVDSQEQTVDLGSVSGNKFRHRGDRSQNVNFSLHFKDCLAGAHEYPPDAGITTKNYWSRGERSVALSLVGTPDDFNNDLLRINGARGVGLRLTDAKSRDMSLNYGSKTFFLSPGDNTLNFNVSVEATQDYVQAGYIDAIVNVNVYYF
ncbi:fimbrial protein [Pantoea endophytica]|uniref:fimbrial protein n=1 Tax=Pantoea endophytica TaxID=92488 RepID=UPI00301734C2